MTRTTTDCPDVPIAVWPTAQRSETTCSAQSSATNRVSISAELARRIIDEYSVPGSLVVDLGAEPNAALSDSASLGHCVHIAHADELQETLEDDFGSIDLIVASPDVQDDEALSIYEQCFDALRPGGLLVTVTKNLRDDHQLIDVAGIAVGLAHRADFRYLQHVVSLRCEVHDGELVAPPDLRVPKRKHPGHLVAHQDVLVFSKGAARV